MDLKRWGKRVYTIDFTVNSQPEYDFVLEWIKAHPWIERTVKISGAVFTFQATNADIVVFSAAITLYHQQDAKLQEMEEYYNEH